MSASSSCSHSPDVAKGTADMVRQMVGLEVPLRLVLGGNSDGGLGTDVGAILAAIDRAWSDAGVAVLVDLGGAETNSEMAVEMLPEARRTRVAICNTPIVEGAVIAATEASGGPPLDEVRRTAEELSPAEARSVSEQAMTDTSASGSVLPTHEVGLARGRR